MKRINEYKKLFNVEGPIQLAELKTSYRTLVKEWHPDKFQEGNEKAVEAEVKSRQITAGYEFLQSIAPETKVNHQEEYNALLSDSSMNDFQHEKHVLSVTFANGSIYEYFGVNERLYGKLINSPTQFRFAKRKIFNSFLYRKTKMTKELV